MSQSVTLRYTPDRQDYARVVRLFFWERLEIRLSLVFLVIAFILIVYTVISNGFPGAIFPLIWLFLPPLFVVYVFFIQPSRIAARASNNEQLVSESTWEVSEAGIQITTRFGSHHLDWESVKKLVTTRDYYLLLSKPDKNTFHFLPRHAFTSPQEQVLFLGLVASHIIKR